MFISYMFRSLKWSVNIVMVFIEIGDYFVTNFACPGGKCSAGE
jgi:hypothetical protein